MIAIDLGSNTLRIIEYDCRSKCFGRSYEKMVKSADGLATTGKISHEALSRIVTAINEAKEAIDFRDHKVIAVTTEAMRRASNSREILGQIYEQTAIKFEIIDPDREANLALLGVKKRLDVLCLIDKNDAFVLVDIGGGSTEIIFHHNGETLARSFEVGIVTLTQRFAQSEDFRSDIHTAMQPIEEFAKEAKANFSSPLLFVATAGTPTTLAAMKLGQNYKTYDSNKINGTKLSKNEIEPLLNTLLSMTKEEQEMAVGVGRSDLIRTGIYVFRRLYTLLGFDECITIDDGLREGVAYEASLGAHHTTSNQK